MGSTEDSPTAHPRASPFSGRTAWARSVQTPLREFLRTETGGAAAFAEVAAQDANLEGSSTTQLAALLAASAPCLILLDEVLEYLVKALPVKSGDGDLAATTLTLIKELSTAVSGVDRVAMIANSPRRAPRATQ